MNHRTTGVVTTMLAATLLLGGCAKTISGSASPVPGQGPVLTKAAPCSLITQEHADALGLETPGRETKGDKAQLLPPMCMLSERDDSPRGVPLAVVWSIDIPLNEYLSGAQPGETFGIGGFTWTRHASVLGPAYCSLTAELTPQSFVEITSEAPLDADASKACDLARAAAPAVASRLPGGEQNPRITAPPGQKKPEPTGPLVGFDACSVLKPDEAAALSVGAGAPIERSKLGSEDVTGCEWGDSDGEQGQRPLDVWFYTATAAADVPGPEGTPEQLDLNGRKWAVYSDTRTKYCRAVLVVTETSAAVAGSGHWDDEKKACDLVRAALPKISAAVPAGS